MWGRRNHGNTLARKTGSIGELFWILIRPEFKSVRLLLFELFLMVPQKLSHVLKAVHYITKQCLDVNQFLQEEKM